jgi:SpoVK/Ycf46/Vps4 family AAA+-type ATPase
LKRQVLENLVALTLVSLSFYAGKTLMAHAVAFEVKATFFSIRPSDVLSKYQGDSERFIRGVFDKAAKSPRAIIFFDGSIAILK